jgi:hypothetical protein
MKEAIDTVIKNGAKKVIFIEGTGFLNRSSHTLIDIPEAIEKLKKIRPDIEIIYSLPDIDLILNELAYAIAKSARDAFACGKKY